MVELLVNKLVNFISLYLLGRLLRTKRNYKQYMLKSIYSIHCMFTWPLLLRSWQMDHLLVSGNFLTLCVMSKKILPLHAMHTVKNNQDDRGERVKNSFLCIFLSEMRQGWKRGKGGKNFLKPYHFFSWHWPPLLYGSKKLEHIHIFIVCRLAQLFTTCIIFYTFVLKNRRKSIGKDKNYSEGCTC